MEIDETDPSPVFVHVGSKFLEEDMKEWVITEGNYNLAKASKVCALSENDVSSTADSKYYELIKKKLDEGCRWIDFVDTKNTNALGGEDTPPVRLAFK